jgi:hypothetical protein
MPEIETREETRAQQTAYYAWVDEAREHGHNTEPDVFRAGWAAARAYEDARPRKWNSR